MLEDYSLNEPLALKFEILNYLKLNGLFLE